MTGSIELAAVFDRAAGERLLAAERLVLSFPHLFRGLLLDCDLAYTSSTRFLAAVARLSPYGFGSEVSSRLAFWTARAGGLASSITAMSGRVRAIFEAHLAQCEVKRTGVAPPELLEAVRQVVTGAGAPEDRALVSDPLPVLAMDAGGPGWEGVAYDQARQALFIPGALAPPVGDEVAVSVRLPGREKPLEILARVSQARLKEEAGPGAPAGFTLELVSPPSGLELAFQRHARVGPARRAAPRYPVKAPVKVTPAAAPARAAPEGRVPGRPVPGEAGAGLPGPAPGPAPAVKAVPGTLAAPVAGKPMAGARPAVAATGGTAAAPVLLEERPLPAPSPAPVPGPGAPATARIEYATDEELARDYLENLSQGGAFVRTPRPLPMGARLTLRMMLPGLVEIEAQATVAFVDEHGMGVKFELDEASETKLGAVIARISARPRRALVVDDDALVRRMLSDALRSRGFEVLTARDGAEGLRMVAEELLTLDLLVTDVRMPGMDGEAFVHTIRQQGGESELAIVVVAGGVDAALDEAMTSAGADAVVDKSLGPELLAQAADAALERKRLTSPS